jgi:YhcH/YjgK/YiaL family protein
MIFDTFEKIDNYKQIEKIHKVLVTIKTMDISSIPLGMTVSLGVEEATIAIKNPCTKPIADCIFESHRQNIDIHCTLEGVEGIGVRTVNELKSVGEFDIQKDIGFHTGDAHVVCFIHAGEFLVCFPSDAHMVGIMQEDPRCIKKLIVKIPVE